MKKGLLLLAVAVLPLTAAAQSTDNDLETAYGGRLSVGVDKKITKGFHVEGEAELRTRDNFSAVGRLQGSLAVSYKLASFLKAGAGYTFMEACSSEGEWRPRHRAFADLSATFRAGDWRFGLKERLQMTHRDGVNVYQTTPNALALKSRAKVSYKGFQALDPYAFAEVRLALNDPSCSASWNGSTYSDYHFTGYSDTYLNRYRGGMGVVWKLSKKHALDLYGMVDYCYDKNIDTNQEGTKLKSLTWDRTLGYTAGVAYVFSF